MKSIRKKAAAPTMAALAAMLALTACGNNSTLNATHSAQPSASSTSQSGGEQVKLRFYSWIGGDVGPTIKEINDRFHDKYPNITVEFETAPTDQYETVIKTRLASGDAPDLLGVYPGMKKDAFVEAGYLMDLSDQAWVSRLIESAKDVASTDNKVYALPLDSNVIGVIYNKKIFADHGLSIPTDWQEFLDVSEKLKAANVTPIALGNKDLWITQLVPYAMAPTAIYQNTPDFDAQMSEGKATFVGSAWNQMMSDYVLLNEKGYFNKGILGTTYDQSTQLMATEKAAMTINGNWMLAPIKQANPDLDLGMFPLPYNEAGEDAWVSASVGSMTAISATTAHPEEAKLYLDFWASPEIAQFYLKEKRAFSTFSDVSVDMDTTAKEMESYLVKGSYNFLDQKWPAGVQDVMMNQIQNVLVSGGNTSNKIDEMLKKMDEAYKSAVNN
ncbi:ABC transporter substrate-binding protein [Cohnella fermenti]|uniref:Extracellular solute-binding protein n=1 Tax=Cohnella fermenti TaxID=2565925 RepID=A0A4S4BFH3_9BACL|nr:extracellular solute-binding protein [Cohnella fermenti]THF72942.1 extracellular solute-binding protein [Cohnella fermenti]